MMASKYVTAVIGVLVAIIVTAVVLVPVVEDYDATRTVSSENQGADENFTLASPSDSLIFELNTTARTMTVTVNGDVTQTFTWGQYDPIPKYRILSDGFVYDLGANRGSIPGTEGYRPTKIVVESGEVTVTGTGLNVSLQSSWILYQNPAGNLGSYADVSKVRIPDGQGFYLWNIIETGSNYGNYVVEYEGGQKSSWYTHGSYTPDDSVSVSESNGLTYGIESAAMSIAGNTVPVNVIASIGYLSPDTSMSLLDVVPLMVILAIMVSAAAMIVIDRRDYRCRSRVWNGSTP